ncbi:glycosyltransferase [Mucilaginibacter phyllosphaerae]|uniref:Glycosyltransferase n=1 Tax=Mucilaginibacter phyllosphaerae TaxID=1812349 RepID=A0A4Y8AG38_9SPHI|nr:glycosyltransferase [Mucilaginibacter phyllosphaerae]MBB3968628.1 glycosyltransferase involved in cell wall biosynthesis [Mucilaginibacter phyllosphaerae]TEW67734.1 glycosyltransferase [Mucilaginibacter phyllosphaerae]GGH14839.1 glycosyl transferase [Mucilaginibacter phyllosphaerae]
MKVALFVGNLQGGGAERMMVNLANSFAALGNETSLLCADFSGPYCAEVANDVTVYDFKKKGAFAAVKDLRSYLKSNQPDYLLTTQSHVSACAVLAHKLSGQSSTKLIIREATTPSEASRRKGGIKSKIVSFLIKQLYNKANGFVAVSEGVRADMIPYYSLKPQNAVVINNPVVTASMDTLAKAPADHPFLFTHRKHITIMGVGRISKVKDFGTLLKALAELKKNTPAKLIILGDITTNPSEYEKLQGLVNELGLQADVSFPGFVANPFAYLSKADVFVLSSLYEGMPGVLIQALACGCQCVSTDCKNGPAEILQGDKYGTLVPVGDFEAMAQAINNASANPKDPEYLKTRSMDFNDVNSAKAYINYFKQL